jgi:hypothetical protein
MSADILATFSTNFTETDPHFARGCKKCAKLHSIHPNGLPRFLNQKRQGESAPSLQVAL